MFIEVIWEASIADRVFAFAVETSVDLFVPIDCSKIPQQVVNRGAQGSIAKGMYMGVEVAIKSSHTYIPTEKRDFRREATLLALCNHPNLMYCYGAQIGEISSLVLPFVPLNLRKLLGGPRMPWTLRLALLKGVTAGLVRLHQCRFLHRDLKPDNILIEQPSNKPWNPRLIDFGMSREANSQMTKSTQFGTPFWLAPELMTESALTYYGGEIDVYSLAVIAAQLYMQIPDPYPHVEMSHSAPGASGAFWSSVKNGMRPEIKKLNEPGASDLVKLIEKGWHKQPKKRSTAAEFLKGIEAIEKKVMKE
jgi:serine/threonine protein kinase